MSEDWVVIATGRQLYHKPAWKPDTPASASYRLSTACRLDIRTHDLGMYVKDGVVGVYPACKKCFPEEVANANAA